MRITVLGKSPAWQDRDGACSGYLVEEAGTTVLLDCGNGVFAKLRRFVDFPDVDAVVISHLHADHFLDLVPFAYALTYAPRRRPAHPRLFAPPGARACFRRVTGAWGSEDLVESAFEVCEYDPDATIAIGPLRARFHSVPHFIPAWAIEISSALGAGRFTFGADSAPTEELARFAASTDLLMLEATLPRPERDGRRGHLTPVEAGEHAARAKARRLVITHFPEELDPQWVKAEAERRFDGEVSVAREGAVYAV